MKEHVGSRVLIRNSNFPKTSPILEVKVLELSVKGVYAKLHNLIGNTIFWIMVDDYDIVDSLRNIENDC